MKVFILGGTGLLGSDAARLLISKGHQVVTVSLPPLPADDNLPKEMEVHLGNFFTMSDHEIKNLLTGCQAFVFAAGVDERVEFAPPVYDAYYKFNIQPLERLLPMAKQCGIQKFVVLGSYFAHFAKTLPHLELEKVHPYIRSRMEQERIAFAHFDDKMEVMVLELPYIFGAQRGRKPVWMLFIDLLMPMKKWVFFPKGGTTMVTVNQVSQIILGCIEQGKGGTAYPVGWYNKTWKELLTIVNGFMGFPEKKIITVPTFAYKLAAKSMLKSYKKRNIEPGLSPVEFASLMTHNCFIDKHTIETELGVGEDDIVSAIGDSITYCMEIYQSNQEVLDMKAE